MNVMQNCDKCTGLHSQQTVPEDNLLLSTDAKELQMTLQGEYF